MQLSFYSKRLCSYVCVVIPFSLCIYVSNTCKIVLNSLSILNPSCSSNGCCNWGRSHSSIFQRGSSKHKLDPALSSIRKILAGGGDEILKHYTQKRHKKPFENCFHFCDAFRNFSKKGHQILPYVQACVFPEELF